MSIGFSFAMAVVADIYHDALTAVPLVLQPIFGNSLVLGTICAVLLNLITRIGVRRRVSIKLAAGSINREAVEQFLSEQGARWAARRDVINRATFGVVQLLEILGDSPEGVEVEASFDEFNLDVRVKYVGAPLDIPERKPTPREIMASDVGERLLAGYLLRRSADRIVSRQSGDIAEVSLHYDHKFNRGRRPIGFFLYQRIRCFCIGMRHRRHICACGCSPEYLGRSAGLAEREWKA